MKNLILWPLILLTLISCGNGGDNEFYEAKFYSNNLATYGKNTDVKRRFEKAAIEEDTFSYEKLEDIIEDFNNNYSSSKGEEIDYFISLLPKGYRRHFTLVHKSFSPQVASPMSPRVIMFGRSARVILTFNDVDSRRGNRTIEMLRWDNTNKEWNFGELEFNKNKISVHHNPQKCMMCHSGTPKPIEKGQVDYHRGYQKPIFAQYPLWPGFYGSVNDIVGINKTGSKDTIMKSTKASLKHIKDLTFSTTEELSTLRKHLDDNPKYLKVVENELDIHNKHFHKFMDSMKDRKRYRHLVTLKDLYEGESIPEQIKSAPYRRTFDKEYGHYLYRPNFHLSTLLTFYHSQYVAKQIMKFKYFDDVKYSFLARKYNCDQQAGIDLGLDELDESFDLFYPNRKDAETINKQYLLAYQYNIARSKQGGPEHLPLHAWNIEPNEEISSYHYGNVFSDLNELVLWNIASKVFKGIKHNKGRSAAEHRHYAFGNSRLFADALHGAGGYVSRMTYSQYDFANSLNPYNDSNIEFTAQPIASVCSKYLIPQARLELAQLKREKRKGARYPHEIYVLAKDLKDSGAPNVNMAKKACVDCHDHKNGLKVGPPINVDWSSGSYHKGVRSKSRKDKTKTMGELIIEKMSGEELPVPFGKQMPFGRKPLSGLALECEKIIIKNAMSTYTALKEDAYLCDKRYPDSINCQCEDYGKKKYETYKKYFK